MLRITLRRNQIEEVSLRQLGSLLSETYQVWNARNAPRLGAALAYYALLSIAPLMILVVAICGLVFRHSAETDVLNQAERYLGSGGAATLASLLASAHKPKTGVLASVIAVVTLLFGASGVFTELQSSLNTIWDVPPKPSHGMRGIVAQRVGSFLMVLALGGLLLGSLVVSTALAIAQQFATTYIPVPAFTGELINMLSAFALLVILFGLVYRYVPDVRIEWRDVAIGSVVTSVLFIVGKSLLSVYFTTAAVGSTYGAAGSIVALVVWVYYSAQIFFFGAVFTRIFASRLGSHQHKRKPLKAKAQAV